MGASKAGRIVAAANIDRMMEHLGIDVGCQVAPRFALLCSCVERNCAACKARERCGAWLAQDAGADIAPPKFCPSFDLLCELFYDSGVGHHTHLAP